MKFQNIEVSGIRRVVFNRERVWDRVIPIDSIDSPNPNFIWQRMEFVEDDTGAVSVRAANPHETLPDAEMMRRIRLSGKNRQFRMWIHGDTLNVVRRRIVHVDTISILVRGLNETAQKLRRMGAIR